VTTELRTREQTMYVDSTVTVTKSSMGYCQR